MLSSHSRTLALSKRLLSSSMRLALISNHISQRTMATSTIQDVDFTINNTARIISLNRASKLNALSTSMCDEITPRLVEFSKSDANNLIIIKSNSDKAFCSGGDVIQAAKYNSNNEPLKSIEFFQKEYSLNYLLSVYGKPIVSLANGIVMGGGVGLSVHGPFRIVCESTRFAMPESNIGFFSDVGTSFWLPKLDGNLGYYLSLTGDELTGYDTLLTGFGTHYVTSSRFDELIQRLSSLELESLSIDRKKELFNNPDEYYALVNEAIEEFSEDVPQNHKFKFTNDQLNTIEHCFDPAKNKSVEEVVDSLLADGSEFALQTVKSLQSKSPISLKLNWALLIKGANSTISDVLKNELALATKMMLNYKPNDFNEFITKNLINKKSADPKDKELKPAFPDLASVPSSVIDDLIDLDAYKPDEVEGSSITLEEKIEILESTNISKFEECKNLIPNYAEYPYNMGLPTQEEIGLYIRGEDNSNRKYSATFKEALRYFQMRYKNKNGITYKVKQVLQRKTKPSEYGEEYLDWVD